ncbi:MAG: right-handed parallel beta-helix repeat-containing protein [Firmicutes bacterium]|nr:right-handed parallel beta-helix repeat-containing protein [Bacillota bacterium]MDY5531809.1 right-handed parallel beta-helix repeat-containing protein [Pumilibacteraceae bacterium]
MKKLLKSKTFLGAVMSIALCVSLIAGATFAIFTSDANVNIAIGTATVKVTAEIGELTTYSGVEITGSENDRIEGTATNGTFTNGGTAKVDGNTVKIDRMTPGDKVTFPVTVTNHSNVTVKYRMRFSYANDNGLFNQLDMKIENYSGLWKELQPESPIATLNCSIALPTSSTLQEGNCNITLLVEAVQGNAAVVDDEQQLVFDTGSLKETLAKGGNIKLESGMDPKEAFVANKDTTLDMNGKTIANTNDVWDKVPNSWSLISARGNAKLTIDGNGTFKAKENDCYAVDVQDGATVTIKNGTFIGNIHAVYVAKGTAIIEGGFYSVQQKYPEASKADEFVLNCYDANRAGGTAKIIVTGGTFVNFNPADCKAEGEHTNFVAEGYSVIKETKENGDVWYEVVRKENTTTVVPGKGAYEDLSTAINKGFTETENGKDVEIKLVADKNVTLDNGIANEGDKARNVTIKGDGSQTVDVAKNAPGAEGATHLNYQRGSTFTFENLTVENGTDTYDGIVCDELIYKNCVIKGVTTLYGKATFINCTFENTMANQYSIWTWGGTDVTFENCTFNTNGKAILLYGHATAAKPTNLVVKNCTFNDRNNGAAGRAAIEIGNDYNATYTLTVEKATVNGYAEGKNTGSKLWANKNSMDAAHLAVTIDGTKVQ